MKLTLSWLKDHLDTQAPLADIVETLTRIGLEVEGVHNPAKELSGFTIGYVVEAFQHPNADKLRVCLVDTGQGPPVQVVCGAPNARTGMKGVFSPPGTYIPGKGITLGVGTIRGVESRGMLCSAMELKISDDHEGIIDLPADAPVGVPYAAWAGLDDPVIDINLTTNRPDCTSIRGIARDLAAAGLGTLKPDAGAPVMDNVPCPTTVTLALPARESWCPLFGLRLVRGVKNGPSPDWMQRRLIAIGLRPINTLVDITNYVTFDRGRPLHVFDAKKVKGHLVVRPARAGETVQALDGRTYTLDETMCVIADDGGVESIAGIMGGEHSGCDETTTDVLIESALWDPLNIASTGRKLGIHTDARYRFERGVDPAYALPGLELATRLVLDLCGGAATDLAVAGAVPKTDREIVYPVGEVARLSGLDVPSQGQKARLEALGFRVTEIDAATWRVVPPSWRPDVHGKADLVEEIVRLVGLDHVPATPLPRAGTVMPAILTLPQKRTRAAKRTLAARGLVEAITWTFIARKPAELFGGGKPDLDLANPIASDLSSMRPSLVPGLIAAAQRNADRGFGDVALFEVGAAFHGGEPGEQTLNACAVRSRLSAGVGAGRHWSLATRTVDAFDAKADALAVLAALGVSSDAVQIAAGGASWLHPGRSGTLRMGPNVLGWFGEVHPSVLEALDADGPLVAFELVLDRVPAPKARATRAKGALDLRPLQPVRRDFAFVVGAEVAAADLVKAARATDRQMIDRISVFDVYTGPGVDEGSKSIAIEVTLQPRERTLTEAEIDAIGAKIVAQVIKATGGRLRA